MDRETIILALSSPVLIGFLLDSLFGDPRWFPHPVKLFGKLIQFGNKILNHGNYRILKGAILVIILVSSNYLLLSILDKRLEDHKIWRIAFTSIFFFLGIANRGLIQEAWKVERKLQKEGVESARKQLAEIVGRDTKELDAHQIRKATLETLSENLSDGIVAPIFFYMLGGIPFMFTYKLVNTFDSMLGYKNDKYYYFGRFAARLDDVLNFVPARITAVLMVLLSVSLRGFLFIFKYGRKHSSPNAGFPEAALAGILNCQFGGPASYKGVLVEKPFIGKNERELTRKDIIKASLINVGVTVVLVAAVFFFEGAI